MPPEEFTGSHSQRADSIWDQGRYIDPWSLSDVHLPNSITQKPNGTTTCPPQLNVFMEKLGSLKSCGLHLNEPQKQKLESSQH